MTEIPRNNQRERQPGELTTGQLALALIAIAETLPEHVDLLQESANRLQQLQNLSQILGLLAPGGTAPRTALEQLFLQSKENGDESPIVLEARGMLEQHWGDWTPAIRKAEGLPQAED